jgi:hypothetical protein
MLQSLGTWLGKLDPNVAVPIALSVLAFLYHHLLSASAQAKAAAALDSAMNLAEKAIGAAVQLAPAGTTQAELEADLLNVAKAQLVHAGLDPAKLPPVVLSLAQALVNVALGKWRATQPATQLKVAPVTPPPAPTGANKGDVRLAVALTIAGITATATMIAIPLVGIAASPGCAAVQKMTGEFATCEKANLGAVLKSVPATLAADLTLAGVPAGANVYEWIAGLVRANLPGLEADLASIALAVGLDTVECAYYAIRDALSAGSATLDAGSAAPAAATPVGVALERYAAWLGAQGRPVK